MPDSMSCLLFHLVFGTKNRASILGDDIRPAFHQIVGGISRSIGCWLYEVNSVEDHIHILVELPRTMSVAHYMKEVKRKTSKWIRDQGGSYADFNWQVGYAAFSVSKSQVDRARSYINNQPVHHMKVQFQAEFDQLLEAHGISLEKNESPD